MGRKIVFVAIGLYCCVVGCVMWPSDRPTRMARGNVPPPGNLVNIDGLKPYCGVAVRLQRVDLVEEYKQTIDRVAAEGADSVSLVVDARQENASRTQMYVDMRKTMTVAQLSDIILHAKAKNLRVVLMPVVLLDKPATDKEWRGTLAPKRTESKNPDHPICDQDSWHEWFDSYREMIEHYARIAQSTGVDVLVVGSELVSSEKDDYNLDEWINTINRVRDIYKGQLTYSSNWDRYWEVPFWKYLDLVGMNSYWDLSNSKDNPTVEEIEGVSHPDDKGLNWLAVQKKMFTWLATQHKPVILLEAGWCSLSNAARAPWDYTEETNPKKDNELQKKLYEAFFQSWWGKSQCAGFMIWELSPVPDDTGKGYTPEGKPAEQTMQDWMKKPRWAIEAK